MDLHHQYYQHVYMYIPRTTCIIYMPEEATHGHTSPDIQSESIFVSARVHLAIPYE